MNCVLYMGRKGEGAISSRKMKRHSQCVSERGVTGSQGEQGVRVQPSEEVTHFGQADQSLQRLGQRSRKKLQESNDGNKATRYFQWVYT